jgi:hypothetical protein
MLLGRLAQDAARFLLHDRPFAAARSAMQSLIRE